MHDFETFVMPKAEPPTLVDVPQHELDIRAFTPKRNFGSGGGTRHYNQIFDDTPHSRVAWQGDVYHFAAELVESQKARRVIDLGCGNALKLRSILEGTGIDAICVDFNGSLEAARRNFPTAKHIEHDLNAHHDDRLVAAIDALGGDEATIIVVSDVIEHLVDPRPILRLIRHLLSKCADNRLVISTPDRALLGYSSSRQAPRNPAHIREWSLLEFCQLLQVAGLNVLQAGHVRENDWSTRKTTSIVLCSGGANYAHLSICLGVQAADIRKILLTTEYPGFVKSGGIGTFVFSQKRLEPTALVLVVVDGQLHRGLEIEAGAIGPAAVLSDEDMRWEPTEDVALHSIEQLMFLLPNVSEVHYQEYTGIGCRVAQAASVGLLPPAVRTVVHCHGNVHYLEVSNQTWMSYGTNPLPEMEKVSIERSSSVVFASEFLRDFYLRTGIVAQEDRTSIVPYWYELDESVEPRQENATTLVFVGKRSRMKGFDLFVEALDDDTCIALKAAGITNISIVGRKDLNVGGDALRRLAASFTLAEHDDLDMFGLRQFVRENASRAIFVAPYRADNFPLVIYDVIGQGGYLLAADAGGIPEMLPHEAWQACLFQPNVRELQERILGALSLDAEARLSTIRTLRQVITASNSTRPPLRLLERRPTVAVTVSVVVPYLNPDIGFLREAIESLNHQTVAPTEVIFVDDGSNEELSIQADECITSSCMHRFRIIRHPKNRGLSAARNSALAACSSDVLVNLDADDIAMNEWIANIATAFQLNPDVGAAVPYLRSLTEVGGEWRPGDYVYRPLGEGLVASTNNNLLGHANSGYRVATVRRLGGWNEGLPGKWEDWELYRKLLASSQRIAVIPSVDILYRVRQNSMARTYNTWEGEQRVSRVAGVLSAFEAIQLYRMLHNQRRIMRVVDEVLAVLNKHPRLKRVMRRVAFWGWGVARTTLRRVRKIP